MKVEQIYTSCLAQGSYYIESNGEAVVIDPLREVGTYISMAADRGAKIKYVFETHFHADFVSGHVDLANKTNSTIIYGPNAETEYPIYNAKDNEEFKLGKITIKALHTPGHTLESTTYLVIDENGNNHSIFTGDTLFIGDVGRPDLAQKLVEDLTQEKLASYLFDSLRNKIMPLSDDLIVYPNHGAGSACGKNMSKETTDTLGNQKKTNYALRVDMTREEFIAELLDGLTPPPAYFPQNVMMNIQGCESLDAVMQKADTPLNPKEFEAVANQTEALILDVRHEDDFVTAHIPGSIFIGLHGQFAPWVGALIKDTKQPILLVTPEGKEEETITRLSRVGFDHTLGYLKGGITAWKAAGFETDAVETVMPEDLANNYEKAIIVDARKPSEFTAERIEKATNIPLDYINDHLAEVPKNDIFYVHCAGGYRSVIWASILKARGYHNMINVAKGINGIKNTNIPLTNYVCPSTLK